MARMGRPGLSDQEKSELWRLWQAGQSLSDIGMALSKHAGSIHGVISLKGGISPFAKRRSSRQLSLQEREQSLSWVGHEYEFESYRQGPRTFSVND
jgi:hypothetical protein